MKPTGNIMKYNLKKIKNNLYNDRVNIIIQGCVRTGKSMLLNYLIPEKYIVCPNVFYSGNESMLSIEDFINFPVIGIDAAHSFNRISLINFIRQATSHKIGIVIICHPSDGINQSVFPGAITINAGSIDLRKYKEFSLHSPILKLVN